MVKKISYFIVLIVLMFLANTKVLASAYYDSFEEHGMWISNEFVNKEKNGNIKYQQMTMIVRKSDNRFVYCIEPGSSLDESKVLTGNDFNIAKYASLTPQQWSRIQLLAYYGYGYEGHTDIKWYVITQFMIWQTNNLGYDIYFTDTLNGNRIDKYIDEMIELDNMVNNYTVIPNFGIGEFNAFLGDTVSYTDNNNVLNKYEIKVGSNITVTKNNNTLNITANNYGNSYVIFSKEEKRFSNKAVVYVDSTSQNLLLPGDLSSVSTLLNVNIKCGVVNIQKLDKDKLINLAQGDASLQNAQYGLYSSDGTLLEQQSTDNSGKISFLSNLATNSYYIQEISPSEGYLLDETKYYFNVNSNNSIINLNVYEKVISENFEIIKVLNNEKTGLTEFEKNVEFGIYDKNDNLISTYITDDFGTIKFSLSYGTYTIKQHTSYSNYEKIEDFIVQVSENDKNNKLVFSDKKLKYKVILNVKDKNTLENINNIEFELYDSENNLVGNYSTDENGEIFFPQYFEFSDYYLKLIVNDNFEYLYDKDIINFTVDENSEYEQLDDYRLIHLKYFLELKPIIEIQEEVEEEDIIEELIEEELVEDEMTVELPNTLDNMNYNWLIVFLGIIILKKLLLK